MVDKATTKILIADDSDLTREFLCDIFKEISEIEIIGQVANGKEAVDFCAGNKPDLVMMDVEMPVMDGIEATQMIMAQNPVPILIFSSLSRSDLSFRAIQAGALDVMEKPSFKEIESWKKNVNSLVRKIQMFSRIKVVRHLRPKVAHVSAPSLSSYFNPRVVLIGASTGGPQALQTLFTGLPPNFPFSIVVVQHMTKGFLEGMVRWIGTTCQVPVEIAQDGQTLFPGKIYFAPEDIFCVMDIPGVLRLTQDLPKWTEHRPCVNYLFRSGASVFPDRTLALLLTGMGKDGAEGMLELRKAGAKTIAQDQATSMIYGMPREAELIGACEQSMSLQNMNQLLIELSGGVKR